MKLKLLFGLSLLTAMTLMASCSAKKAVHGIPTPAHDSEIAVPDNQATGNLIIYYDPETGNKELLAAAEEYGSEILYVYKNLNGIAVTVPNGKSVDDAIKYYEQVHGVLSVHRDRIMHLD